MPPKYKKKDCLIILVNIGGTDEKKDENEMSFLEKSKLVMKHLIQRKIFLLPKNEVGIILMGASETKNRLCYDNIVEMNSLQIPTWDLVESIAKLQGTKESCNWVDGMHVVLEYLKTENVDQSTSETVILFTDFKEELDVIEQYDIKSIANDIRARDISLLAIGNKSFNGDSQIELNPSEEIFVDVCKMVGGETMTFDDTLPKLMIYKDKSKTAMPWKVDMDLFDIQIPIVMYLKTTEDFHLPQWQLHSTIGTSKMPVERGHSLVDKNKQEVEDEEIITGYMYGRKFVPFSDEDKDALKYESGPKGFMIYGFAKRELITMDCLAGKGSYIVVPAQQYASPFYSLVKAMADKNRVAIVRRVYRANLAPKMGVLIPKIDEPEEPWCLLYIELVFAEDRRIIQVKPVTSTMNELSEEQEDAIDNLVDAMMLTEVEDDTTGEKTEAFAAGTVPNVSRQHIWDKLAHRALNPNSPLPTMSDFLKTFLEPPKSVKKKSKPVLKSIKTLFPIKSVQKKKSARKSFDTAMDGLEEITEGAALTKDKINIADIIQGTETEDEELSEIVDFVEANSQGMDIDLEELAKDM